MRPARRNVLALAGIGAAAAAGGALVGALVLQSQSGVAELLAARFPDLEGQPRRLIEWQGRPLVCNFWATWCAPCREEIPMLVAAKQQYASAGLEILGIGIDSAAKMREFAAIHRVNYPILVSGPQAIELMRGLGNHAGALPFSALLDRSGTLAGTKLGAYTKAELDTALLALLG